MKNKIYLNFEDVMIKPKLSSVNSRSEVNLRTFKLNNRFYAANWNPVPIMSSNMDTVTGIEMAFELVKKQWVAVLHKYVSIQDIIKLFDRIDEYNKNITIDGNMSNKIDYRNVFISRGTTREDKIKLKERLEAENRIKSVCIDVANGYRDEVFKYIEDLRINLCKEKILMIGNIATPDAFIKYGKIGIDLIKCGIGSGSACITRVKTGVGVPQISMITEIHAEYIKALHNYEHIIKLNNFNKSKEPILSLNKEDSYTIEEQYSNLLQCKMVSDGGCVHEGDISKAFVAGSEFVMIGGMLSGHHECPGTVETINNKKVMRYSGMAAKESQHNGVPNHGTEEGKTVYINYKGNVKHTISDIEGGLRSTGTYIDADSIDKFKNAELIRSTVQENRVYNS